MTAQQPTAWPASDLGGRAMNPAARLSVALVTALVLWLPTLAATMRGDIDLIQAAVRYLVAFVLARVAVGGIARLIHSYSVTGDDDAARRTDPECAV